jgi:hypothetical protein
MSLRAAAPSTLRISSSSARAFSVAASPLSLLLRWAWGRHVSFAGASVVCLLALVLAFSLSGTTVVALRPMLVLVVVV